MFCEIALKKSYCGKYSIALCKLPLKIEYNIKKTSKAFEMKKNKQQINQNIMFKV